MNNESAFEKTADKRCPRCGATVAPDAPEGLCPKCVAAFPFDSATVFDGELTPTAATPTPEELAPHFPQLEILGCLGRGGMGVVYKARQKSLNRLVALKLLAPERVHDTGFAERFAREARALAALNHPNIVAIYDHGEAGGYHYLLMEFVDGVNLRRAMRAGKFTPEQALVLVPAVCDALQYAHDHGVVHRDIKPENLLLDREGRVKVADFGIAKLLDATGVDTGLDETAAGTPQYMAPEQFARHATDHRADIYSLGVVLYELLTGELPGAKLEAPSRKVHIDVRLDAIVLRALERSPELRFENATAMKTQVETVAGGIRKTPAQIPGEITQAEADTLHADPTHWKWGWVYWCKRDPRLIVSKRNAVFGWTMNFAHGASWLVMAAILAPVMAIHSQLHNSLMQGWPLVAMIVGYLLYVVLLSVQLSKVKSTRRVSALVPTLLSLGILFGAMGAIVWHNNSALNAEYAPPIKAMHRWLAGMDAGRYGESWESSAEVLHDGVSKVAWVASLEKYHRPMGQLVLRGGGDVVTTTSPVDAKPGANFTVRFASRFANGEAVETVTCSLEPDGIWRASGYYINPYAEVTLPGQAAGSK